MSSRRLLKAARAIREAVSTAVLYEMKDPRVRDVTVTRVEVMEDMRMAKVYVSIMGDETKQNLSLIGLRNAAGFLQSKVAERIDTRYTPKLVFILDEGVKKSIEVMRLLKEVLPSDQDDDDQEEPETGSQDHGDEDDADDETASPSAGDP
jgi:ribosome-binding factor A